MRATGADDDGIRRPSSADAPLEMALYEQHRVQQCLKGLMNKPLWTPEDTIEFDCMHYDGDAALDRAAERLALPRGARILDIGSGYGSTGRYLCTQYGLAVTGLELQHEIHDIAVLINARQFVPEDAVRAVHGDVLDDTTAAVLGGDYDGVVSFLVILHIPDRATLFRRLASLLRPGGRAYIEDYVRGRELSSNECERLLKVVACPYLPDRATYEEQAKSAGFKVVSDENVSPKWKGFTKSRVEVYARKTEAVPSMISFYETVAELFSSGAVEGMCLTLERC
ncbi:methyltransferase [Schizophyllum amplum]|uniref:phosphoethanolamine N-methyltransferase n=1 Tax=Schizophyllum amplum TaxID=97359 RepID=A0A550CJN9_9AGAR|nr:methyltransferase [Auriculariopsis ampla]